MQHAYTSTVVSPVLAALGVMAGTALSFWPGPTWWPAAGGVLVLVVSVQLSTVHLRVAHGEIRIRHGWFPGTGRRISTDRVRESTAAQLSWPQVFGLAPAAFRRAMRSTVRPGPTLCLRLADGESVRVSTPFPLDACRLIDDPELRTGRRRGDRRVEQPEEDP